MMQPTSTTIVIRAAYAVAWRHLYKWFTMPANFIPTVAFPLVFFTAFAGGLSAVQKIPGFHYESGYTAFQFAFVLLQASAFGGVATGFTIAGDFATGFATRLMLCSAYRGSIVLGYMCSSLVRSTLVVLLLTLVAIASGMRALGSPSQIALIVVICVLLNMSATLWGAGVMMRARNPQFAPAMQIPVFVGLFIAPVYLPLALLDGWIHDAAQVNPLSWMLGSVRGLLNGTPDHTSIGLACVGVMVCLAFIWGFTGLRRAERAG